ncbi:hypothetical protein ACA910_006899 [Epithemia clementina (nom. ined.)]
MSLTTGCRLTRHQWTVLPVTQAVIDAVERLAERQRQPIVHGGVPLLEWRAHEPILEEPVGELGIAPVQEEEEPADNDEEHADEDRIDVAEDEQNEPPDEGVDALVDDDATDVWDGYEDDEANPEEGYEAEEQNEPDGDPDLYVDVDEHVRELGAALAPDIANIQEDFENNSVHKQDEEEIHFVEEKPVRIHGYGLRPNRGPLSAYRFGFEEEATEGANGVAFVQEAKGIFKAEEFEPQSMHTLLCEYLFTQMSAKQDI